MEPFGKDSAVKKAWTADHPCLVNDETLPLDRAALFLGVAFGCFAGIGPDCVLAGLRGLDHSLLAFIWGLFGTITATCQGGEGQGENGAEDQGITHGKHVLSGKILLKQVEHRQAEQIRVYEPG
jgi:hypothetical protein